MRNNEKYWETMGNNEKQLNNGKHHAGVIDLISEFIPRRLILLNSTLEHRQPRKEAFPRAETCFRGVQAV